MPNRNGTQGTGDDYRYGFNGMEADDEIKGTKNSYDFGARMYDPRVGKFLSIDPKTIEYTDMSPYAAFNNNPIVVADPTGESGIVTIEGTEGNPGLITITVNAFLYGNGATSKLATASEDHLNNMIPTIGMKYMVNGQEYDVKLDFNVEAISEDEACRLSSANSDYANNFLRVEDYNEWQEILVNADETGRLKQIYNGRQGFLSEMTNDPDNVATNTGFLISTGLTKDLSVLFHELTHGWGSLHDDVANFISLVTESMPVSLPDNTPSSKYPELKNVITNDKGVKVLDATKRVFTTVDLNILFNNNGVKLNGTKSGIEVTFTDGKYELKLGAIDNTFYDSDGAKRPCEDIPELNTEVNEE